MSFPSFSRRAMLLPLPYCLLALFPSNPSAAFDPNSRGISGIGGRATLSLKANVATSFILQEFEKEQKAALENGTLGGTDSSATIAPMKAKMSAGNGGERQPKQKLSRPERKALERAQKQKRNNNNNKKANKTQSKKYELHSQAISSLSSDSSTADDVLRAIKRAQNLHDADDLKTIETFLLEEVDEDFAYGYRGSLLSRLAVAALHMNNHELARRAIDVRRVEYRTSMLPMESAAIVRGLLRVKNVTDALETLEDELSLPLQVRTDL